MINQNVPLTPIDRVANRYTITLADPELTKLAYKYGSVNVKISRPEEPGTQQQNKAMHALMTAFFFTGMHSSSAKDPEEFKAWLKFTIGVCHDYEFNGERCKVAKSWAQYSKHERKQFIDALLSMVHQSGAYSEDERCREIIDGMGSERY